MEILGKGYDCVVHYISPIFHSEGSQKHPEENSEAFMKIWKSTWRTRAETSRDSPKGSLTPFYVRLFWSRRSVSEVKVRPEVPAFGSISKAYFRIHRECSRKRPAMIL